MMRMDGSGGVTGYNKSRAGSPKEKCFGTAGNRSHVLAACSGQREGKRWRDACLAFGDVGSCSVKLQEVAGFGGAAVFFWPARSPLSFASNMCVYRVPNLCLKNLAAAAAVVIQGLRRISPSALTLSPIPSSSNPMSAGHLIKTHAYPETRRNHHRQPNTNPPPCVSRRRATHGSQQPGSVGSDGQLSLPLLLGGSPARRRHRGRCCLPRPG